MKAKITFNNNNIIQIEMNENCNHPIVGAFFEKLRKESKTIIKDLTREARISSSTYEKIKKGLI